MSKNSAVVAATYILAESIRNSLKAGAPESDGKAKPSA